MPETRPVADEEEALGEDLPDLLHAFDDEQDLDDSMAEDLDPGIPLEGDETSSDESDDPFPDLADETERFEEAEAVAEGDESGPLDDDPETYVSETEPLDDDDGSESADTGHDLLGTLPALDADHDEAEGEAPDLGTLAAPEDEDPPPPAERPWILQEIDSAARSLVLQSSLGRLVAGPGLALVNDAGAETPLAANPGGTVTSVVADGAHGSLLYTTRGGQVFRVDGSGAPRLVSGWLEAGGFDRQRAFELSLGGPTRSARKAVLLHVASRGGALLESTDFGNTWRRVELKARVVALGVGTPPMCVVETDKKLRLVRSASTGGFKAVGSEWLRDDAEVPRLAVHEDVVALLEPGHGVRVSADGGVTLRRVRATARATAIAAGLVAARPSAFAALYDFATGRSLLVWIDAATAEAFVIAEIAPRADDEDGESARVLSVTWDENTETLWAAGGFGLFRWRRPPSA